MFKRRRIGEFLERLDRIPVPDEELVALEEAVVAEITGLWQTDEVRSSRPKVADEIKMGLDYYDVSISKRCPGSTRKSLLHSRASTASISIFRRTAIASRLWLLDRRRSRRQSICNSRGYKRSDSRCQNAPALLLRRRMQLLIDLLTTSAQQLDVSEELRGEAGVVSESVTNRCLAGFGAHFQFELYRRFLVACIRAYSVQPARTPPIAKA